MTSKAYLFGSSLVFLLVVLSCAIFNFCTDRFGIYSTDFQTFYHGIQPNRHYLKRRYVLDNPQRFRCFLFGSSRVSNISAQSLGDGCFNFTHSGGIPVNHEHALRLFLEAGVAIDKVYIGLDDISYTWNADEHHKQFLRRPYPASLRDTLRFHAFYLLRIPAMDDWELVNGYRTRNRFPWLVVDPERSIIDWRSIRKKEPERFGDTDKFMRLPPTILGWERKPEASIESLSRIVAMAREYGFELILFFNPMHYKTYLANDLGVLADFKRRVSLLQSYWDFSGLNDIALDNHYWQETSHFTPEVGDKIVEVLRDGHSDMERFERWVTSDNISALTAEEHRKAAAEFPAILGRGSSIMLPATVAGMVQRRGVVSRQPLFGDSLPQMIEGETLVAADAGGVRFNSRSRARLVWPSLRLPADEFYIVEMKVWSSRQGWVNAISRAARGGWRTGSTVRSRLYRGDNSIALPLVNKFPLHGLRIDFPGGEGEYLIRDARLVRVRQ